MSSATTVSFDDHPVFTGAGIIAPTGVGTEEFRRQTLNGTFGLTPISRFDATRYNVTVAGEAKEFISEEHLGRRILAQTDRTTQMALVIADEAAAQSGLSADTIDPFDIGVMTASTAGGFEFGQNELRKLWREGSKHVSAYQSFAWFYAVNSGQISIRQGWKGPSGVLVSDQTGGLDALGQARRELRNGTAAVLSGGTDAVVCPWAWVALMDTGELSNVSDPTTAYLPFSRRSSGWIPGEGGAMFVLERADHAASRNAIVMGRLSGYGRTFDPAPWRDRTTNLSRAILLALSDAGISSNDIGFVVADGYGCSSRDTDEVTALRAVFGEVPPIVLTKTATGRLMSGAGPVDVLVALQSLGDGLLPPAPGLENENDLPLDIVVGSPRRHSAEHGLVIARGIGGFNSCVVISQPF